MALGQGAAGEGAENKPRQGAAEKDLPAESHREVHGRGLGPHGEGFAARVLDSRGATALIMGHMRQTIMLDRANTTEMSLSIPVVARLGEALRHEKFQRKGHRSYDDELVMGQEEHLVAKGTGVRAML